MYSIERKFVLTANTQLQNLDRVWGVKPQKNGAEMCAANKQNLTQSALGAIKSAAAGVKARGIMRSAGFCEDVYSRLKENESAKLLGALAGLKTLVYQYADGLIEIDPAFRDSLQNSEVVYTQKQDNAQTTSKTDINADHLQASAVLKPLLHLVKTDSRKSALQKIMQVSQERETQSTPVRREALNPPTAIAVKFETLMRSITNLTLSEARHSDKRVSISYATDFDEIGLAIANTIQEFIEVLCLSIVSHSVQNTGSTQISISGQVKDNAYIFDVQWTGTSLQSRAKSDVYFRRVISELIRNGGTTEFSSDGDRRQKLGINFPRTHRHYMAELNPSKLPYDAQDVIKKGATG